ncbi:MAG TPA: hypothetical protein VJR89_05735 [Polyangiales bacterium]|nr:hypothetical protein [Polyangiales bacterium]
MASRAGKRLWYTAGLALIHAACAACGEANQTLQVTTQEVAEGDYYGLAWGGTQVERFHVLARTGGEPEDVEVKLISPNHKRPCSLGHVAYYGTNQPRSGNKFVLGSPSPARVILFDSVDEHGVGTMSFADIDCKRIDFEVPDLLARDPLRLYSPDSLRVVFAMGRPENSVVWVDPWQETATEVADGVEKIWPSDNGAWLSEKGELVKRDLDGRERRRKKTKSVTQLLQLGLNGDMAYIDSGTLYLEVGGKTTEVANDVCSVQALDGFIPGSLAYFSPCSERRLVVRPQMGKPIVLMSGVAEYLAMRGQLFVVKQADETTQIYMARLGAPDKLGLWLELPKFNLRDLWPAASGDWMLVAVRDKNITLYRATDQVPSAPPRVVFEDLVDLRTVQQRALALLRPDNELELYDRDGENLLLKASGVTRFRFVFTGSSAALIYLSGVDMESGLGQLRLKFLTGEHFAVARDVRDFTEVWWPERGILYTRGGDKAGIEFARVEIPCEMTSDAPWTCGF